MVFGNAVDGRFAFQFRFVCAKKRVVFHKPEIHSLLVPVQNALEFGFVHVGVFYADDRIDDGITIHRTGVVTIKRSNKKSAKKSARRRTRTLNSFVGTYEFKTFIRLSQPSSSEKSVIFHFVQIPQFPIRPTEGIEHVAFSRDRIERESYPVHTSGRSGSRIHDGRGGPVGIEEPGKSFVEDSQESMAESHRPD